MSQVKEHIKQMYDLITWDKNDKSTYYNGIFDFLIREGRLFKSEALTEDEKTAVNKLMERIISTSGTPKHKQCYYNAQTALFCDYDKLFRYSEGYAMSDVGLALPHGFLTINEKVVDLTWRDKDGNFYVGETTNEYFGVRFDSEDILRAMLDTEMAQSHIECYWNNGLLFKQKFNDSEPYYLPNIEKRNP